MTRQTAPEDARMGKGMQHCMLRQLHYGSRRMAYRKYEKPAVLSSARCKFLSRAETEASIVGRTCHRQGGIWPGQISFPKMWFFGLQVRSNRREAGSRPTTKCNIDKDATRLQYPV